MLAYYGDYRCGAAWLAARYTVGMRTLTVPLPRPIVESAQCAAPPARRQSSPLDAIADIIGSVDGLPAGLSTRKKRYLKVTGYGRKRAR